MPDLHARLLAEIERREDIQRMNMMPPVIQRPIEIRDLTAEAQRMAHADEVLAYLAALRGVVELHVDAGYSQGYVDDPDRASGRRYSEFYQCCRSCGTPGEFGIPWPCKTLLAVATALDVTP